MPFGPSYEYQHNSNLDPIQNLFQGFYQNLNGSHGMLQSERRANRLAGELIRNPADSSFFDVFKYKAAAAKRDAVRNQDPYEPAGLSQSKLQHTNDHIDQEAMGQAGSSYQQFLQGLLGTAGQLGTARRGQQLDALHGQAQTAQASDQLVQHPGWGSFLMQGLGSAAGAFNPFSLLGGAGGGIPANATTNALANGQNYAQSW